MKKKLLVMSAGIFMAALFAFVPKTATQDPWKVPDAFKNKVNPTKDNAASTLATGKTLYNQHCKSCHGTKGKGDGPKASQLDTECGDFTKDLASQTDGALFYKTFEGRKDMPSFKKKIPDVNDIWALVNYMRTFK